MSSLLYPTLPGIEPTRVRYPEFTTGKQVALSKKRSTIAYQAYPVMHFEHTYEFLNDAVNPSDFKALNGLFMAMQGSFDTFLFSDPEFNSVTLQQFAVGDGNTTLFPITAIYQNSGGPGFQELIQSFNGSPSFYDNGTLVSPSAYTLGPSISPFVVNPGFILFNAAPAAGHPLTWTGSFYYRCAFDDDTIDLTKFFQNGLWKSGKIAFTEIKL